MCDGGRSIPTEPGPGPGSEAAALRVRFRPLAVEILRLFGLPVSSRMAHQVPAIKIDRLTSET